MWLQAILSSLSAASSGSFANLRAPLPAGGFFSKTELSDVLTEILRVDPTFDKDRFLHQCETDIIPNILEVRAMPQAVVGP